MEQRARSVEVVKYQYYSLLYCYHIARNNRRKGKGSPSLTDVFTTR